jgi:MerR family transcriptional regulator, light-induced transcriptional regulator
VIKNKNEFRDYIIDNKQTLTNQIYEYFLSNYPEFKEKYSKYQLRKTWEDFSYSLIYLTESIALSKESIFLDYIVWLKGILINHNVDFRDLQLSLYSIKDILIKKIDNNDIKNSINNYLNNAIDTIQKNEAENKINNKDYNNPYREIKNKYIAFLLNGERNKAMDLIHSTVKNNVSIKDIYIHIFQESLYEIGNLWEENIISVAQEHYCTASTQLIMSQLYSHIFNTKKNGLKLVSASVSGELHEIGIRMISDFLEIDGWDTYYLGSNMPVEGIIHSISKYNADLVAISCTMMFHIDKVKQVIEYIKKSDVFHKTKVMVGGYPFNKQPDLWKDVGADAYAKNAKDAVKTAFKTVKKPN